MAILITGVEGFLGRRLATTLHEMGESVVGLDVVAARDARPWPVLVGDVADAGLVDRIFADREVANLFHCGGVSGPHICNSDPARVFRTNVLGTLNLFESAKRTKMPGRFVFLSSSSAYGEAAAKQSRAIPVDESLPLLASEPYGASKVACEAVLRAYASQESVDAVALRISIVYGPGRSTYCGISELIKAANAGKPMVLGVDCDVPLPWVHIDDVCSALISAMKAPRERLARNPIRAYNVTGPGYPTFREIADCIRKWAPPATVTITDQPDMYAMNARKMSLTSIKADLDWEPTINIEAGVRSLYEACIRSNS